MMTPTRWKPDLQPSRNHRAPNGPTTKTSCQPPRDPEDLPPLVDPLPANQIKFCKALVLGGAVVVEFAAVGGAVVGPAEHHRQNVHPHNVHVLVVFRNGSCGRRLQLMSS